MASFQPEACLSLEMHLGTVDEGESVRFLLTRAVSHLGHSKYNLCSHFRDLPLIFCQEKQHESEKALCKFAVFARNQRI